MKNYVISLKNQTKRREHTRLQFERQSIPFEFFDAVTPDQAEGLIKRFHIQTEKSCMADSEYGCLFSHMLLWQKMVDESIPYIAIFEDDVHLGKGANVILKDGSWLPNDFDVIHVEKYHKRVYTNLFSSYRYKDFSFYNILALEFGTCGYIISLKCAKFLLDYVPQIQKIMPVDHILFEIILPIDGVKVWQMNPAISMQDEQLNPNSIKLASSITSDRLKMQERLNILPVKKKIPLYRKVIRELIRPFRQLSNLVSQLSSFSYYRRINFYPVDKKD